MSLVPRNRHPEVPQRQSFRVSLPSGVLAPKIARTLVADLLVLTDHGCLADPAQLLVSEIVTNVHMHTGTPVVHVDVAVRFARIRVAVWDDAPYVRPQLQEERDGDERGRGLHLVHALASHWGVTWPRRNEQSIAKHVWFALDHDDREEIAACPAASAPRKADPTSLR
ncbi:ATP-binding protein [Streptomyces sp. NPDC057654]|uniref:ATP-binding protein n=1 Tax=Streptomyces sp. NPDC057654 TaxID=3346196 RepID=UPI0036A44D2A